MCVSKLLITKKELKPPLSIAFKINEKAVFSICLVNICLKLAVHVFQLAWLFNFTACNSHIEIKQFHF